MKSNLKIFKPSRRTCPGKTLRYNITQLNPASWLESGNEDFIFSELDGYAINQNGTVSALLSRYEFEGEYVDRIQFTELLLAQYGNELHANMCLANQLKVPYRIFVWPKDFPDQHQAFDRKIIVYLPTIKNKKLDLSEAKWINLKGLAAGIKRYRGRSFMSVKSLGSANSNVECYLANQTKDPWPGDLDGYITERNTGVIKSLIEFKTHNIDSPTEKEFIGKYGKQDWRRFEVLYRLQDAIQSAQGSRPKLFYVVWGTREYTNHKNLKVDEIENGELVNTNLIERPKFGSFSPQLFDLLSK